MAIWVMLGAALDKGFREKEKKKRKEKGKRKKEKEKRKNNNNENNNNNNNNNKENGIGNDRTPTYAVDGRSRPNGK